MKISIITVVYNNQKTIENAITSVLSQSYSNIEYIIIDGDSTDKTKDIIRKHVSKITKFVSEKDNGIYDAMNKGILLATGELIAILNSDDIYNDNDVLADVARKFIENENLSVLYGDLVYVDPDDTNIVRRKWLSRPYKSGFFERGNVPPHPALFVKKEVYNECGLFNVNYKLAADYDFMLRVFKKYNYVVEYFPRLMVRMRLGGATNKNISNIIDGNREILSSWRNNGLKAPLLLMPFRIFKRLIQFI